VGQAQKIGASGVEQGTQAGWDGNDLRAGDEQEEQGQREGRQGFEVGPCGCRKGRADESQGGDDAEQWEEDGTVNRSACERRADDDDAEEDGGAE
jgi:hypothetical protein